MFDDGIRVSWNAIRNVFIVTGSTFSASVFSKRNVDQLMFWQIYFNAFFVGCPCFLEMICTLRYHTLKSKLLNTAIRDMIFSAKIELSSKIAKVMILNVIE